MSRVSSRKYPDMDSINMIREGDMARQIYVRTITGGYAPLHKVNICSRSLIMSTLFGKIAKISNLLNTYRYFRWT
jgi:hypothetical protein